MFAWPHGMVNSKSLSSFNVNTILGYLRVDINISEISTIGNHGLCSSSLTIGHVVEQAKGV
jgi:hypothetical protein